MLIEDQITIEVSARMNRIFVESRFHRQVCALARAGREAKKICRPGRIEMPVAAERAGQRIGLGRESDIIELVGAVHRRIVDDEAAAGDRNALETHLAREAMLRAP